MTHRTMRCQEALQLLASFLDSELEGSERFDLERHLETCRGCFARSEFEKRLKSHLGELRQRELEPQLQQRINTLIHQFTEQSEPDPT